MKFQLTAALIGFVTTSAVSAQQQQTGPFNLQVEGTNPSSNINGYIGNCHAGAGISALCYSTSNGSSNFDYYFNYTGFSKVGDDELGSLVWNLPYTDVNGQPASVSQAMSMLYQTTSNVASPMFGISQDTFYVGFDSDGMLFGFNYIDDSKFVPGELPTANLMSKAYYQWAVCWQYFSGYYYQSLAWVQLGTPHNPTCEPVTITKS